MGDTPPYEPSNVAEKIPSDWILLKNATKTTINIKSTKNVMKIIVQRWNTNEYLVIPNVTVEIYESIDDAEFLKLQRFRTSDEAIEYAIELAWKFSEME